MHDEGTASAVNVDSSQGVQNGFGNIQNNTYVQRAPLGPASLSGLNPHTAADRILKLPPDEILYLFASMSSQEVPEIIAALLAVDQAKAVAVLGDLSSRKLAELIDSLAESAKWLANIPAAAEEISKKATELGWSNADVLRRRAAGFFRKYPDGSIIWSRLFGTHAIVGDIEALFAAGDNPGFPTGAYMSVPSSPFGTGGIRQKFVAGVIYSSEHGTYLVPHSDVHDAEGGGGGWLGFPTSETTAEPVVFGSFQRFEGGSIFAHYVGERQVAFAVHRDVIDALPNQQNFWPVSKSVPVVSPLGSSGQVQRFLVNSKTDGGREAAVCSSNQLGIYVIAPEIWNYYRSMGDSQSWLGYPGSSWRRTGMLSGMQCFEGGAIFWQSDIGAFAVSSHIAVSAVIGDGPGIPGKLGYPVSEEYAISSAGDRIQFFERGIFSLRNGKREIWLTPEQSEQGEFFSSIPSGADGEAMRKSP